MIEHMLVLSTAHITHEVAEALDERLTADANPDCYLDTEEWADNLVFFPKCDYGWFIYVPDKNGDVPQSLAECFNLARANLCPWLMLDRDATVVSNLPAFYW